MCICTSRFSSLQKLLNKGVASISFSFCAALQSTQQGCRSCFYELLPLNMHTGVLNHTLILFLSFDAHLSFFFKTIVTVSSTHPPTVCKDHFTPLPHLFFLFAFILFFLFLVFFFKATLVGLRRYIIVGLINISMIIMHSFHGLEGQWDVFL